MSTFLLLRDWGHQTDFARVTTNLEQSLTGGVDPSPGVQGFNPRQLTPADVADHRAHEDRIVADENRMTHSIAPLEQDLRDQRVNVDENDDVVLQVPETADQRVARAAVCLDVLFRDRLHVHHFVYRHTHHPSPMLDEDDRAPNVTHLWARAVQPRAQVEHRDDRATQIDQPLDVRRRAR